MPLPRSILAASSSDCQSRLSGATSSMAERLIAVPCVILQQTRALGRLQGQRSRRAGTRKMPCYALDNMSDKFVKFLVAKNPEISLGSMLRALEDCRNSRLQTHRE